MKKITKTFLIISLALIMCLSSIPVFASEADTGISPRLSHMGGGSFSFSATESGGNVVVTYEGYDSFVQARVTVKLQKRFLLVFSPHSQLPVCSPHALITTPYQKTAH